MNADGCCYRCQSAVITGCNCPRTSREKEPLSFKESGFPFAFFAMMSFAVAVYTGSSFFVAFVSFMV